VTELLLSGDALSLETVWQVMRDNSYQVKLTPKVEKLVLESRKKVDQVLEQDQVVYGINTGFGSLAQVRIPAESLSKLQSNLIRSHCVGVGEEFSDSIVRGVLLIRAHTLSLGFSGVRLELVQRLLDFLNQGILPRIPEIGSLGASGDLAPLAHLSLALIGEGEVHFKGKRRPSSDVLKELGWAPLDLQAKEGLALINGTPVMCAVAVEVMARSKFLLKTADILGAVSVEALSATDRPFLESLHRLRPHPGQGISARNLRDQLQDSHHIKSHQDCSKVQDAYSLRCIPQVHGACYDAYFRSRETLEIELNSVTDNPLVLEEGIISCGNFHGEPLAMVLGYLSLALCELGSISERRQNRLVNHDLSGLPAFLIPDSGLNSGYMIAHYTSAACVSENKILSHPAVVDSIPTSADQEDHVSMGLTAARNALKISENLESILSIELVLAFQALGFVGEHKTSPCMQEIASEWRSKVSLAQEDRVYQKDIEEARSLIQSCKLVHLVEARIGDMMRKV
jgi:histidine ammonia-lyase